MAIRLAVRAFALVAGLGWCPPATVDAADSSKLAAVRGQAILQQRCGACHAIEAVGASPLREAPPMRTIYNRFNLRDLEERFSEGVGSAHKDMPQIQFSDDDVYAILSYLYALAGGK